MGMIAVNCPICTSCTHTNSRRIAREILRHGCDVCRGYDEIGTWRSYRLEQMTGQRF